MVKKEADFQMDVQGTDQVTVEWNFVVVILNLKMINFEEGTKKE